MGFSRQEYWSGVPFPSPGDLPDPAIKPSSPALQADSLPFELPGNLNTSQVTGFPFEFLIFKFGASEESEAFQVAPVVKNPPANAGDIRGFDRWVGKIPWRRAWQPTPVFLPGESHGQRSLAGSSP